MIFIVALKNWENSVIFYSRHLFLCFLGIISARADNADSASNTLSVLLKFVSNDNNALIPAISMEKSPYMIE
jgi:hypothetical protein